jgi:hypothetical protein
MRWGMGFADPHDDVSHRLARWVAGMRARQSETMSVLHGPGSCPQRARQVEKRFQGEAGPIPTCVAPTKMIVTLTRTRYRSTTF